MWIGVNDLSKEEGFRLMNGTEFVADRNSVYDWSAGEPNNHDGEDCVLISPKTNGLNDENCITPRDAMSYYGLCEIKKVSNCIVK